MQLNASKTKEITVDFRRKKSPLDPLVINGEDIERVTCFKFLGTIISDDLKWEDNIKKILKKAHQRLYFLRQLKKIKIKKEILHQFYSSTIESILTFSIIVWYGSTTVCKRNRLNKIIKTASKIVGHDLQSLSSIYEKRVQIRSQKILKDSLHPASKLYTLLPSQKRFRYLKTKTNRFKNSFFSKAMTIVTVP